MLGQPAGFHAVVTVICSSCSVFVLCVPASPFRATTSRHMLYKIECYVSLLPIVIWGSCGETPPVTLGGLMFRENAHYLVGDVMIQAENSGPLTRPAHSPKSP